MVGRRCIDCQARKAPHLSFRAKYLRAPTSNLSFGLSGCVLMLMLRVRMQMRMRMRHRPVGMPMGVDQVRPQ